VADAEWRRVYEEVVEGSLRAFYGSAAFARIRETPPARWLTVDELDSWTFEGVKIWVAIDFASRDADGRIHLLDWKTGKHREADHAQVAGYALYAGRKWGVEEDAVRGGLVYLGGGDGGEVEVQADAEALRECQEEMRQSIGAMRAVLDDPARNVARVERFPQLEDRETCGRCPFRRPCRRL
jgi:RecB family exonuclease